MQLGQMRSWLKALMFLAVLMGGLPSVVWAHAGHDHGAQPSIQGPLHTISVVGVAPIDVKRAGGCAYSVLQRLGPLFSAVVATECAARTSRRHGDQPSGTLRSDLLPIPAEVPGHPPHQGNCCCGSITCHAGMDIQAPEATIQFMVSHRVELSPTLTIAGVTPGGIERPPRPGM